MNYLAHGRCFLHDPYLLIGTALPDMLSVVDRQVRVRAKGAALWVADADPWMAALARGIQQHHADDDWFHQTTAFNELNVAFTGRLRECLPDDDGYRPAFLGHILVEILLDAWLSEQSPNLLTEYYACMAEVNPALVQSGVNRIAAKPTTDLVHFIPRFLSERFLFDYTDDTKLLFRLNQVMRRVRLPPLTDSLRRLFPEFRQSVQSRAAELLGQFEGNRV
jgi:hypothetical protein